MEKKERPLCYHRNATYIKMGSDELHFINCEGQSHKTVSTDPPFEEKARRAEADSNTGPSAKHAQQIPAPQRRRYAYLARSSAVGLSILTATSMLERDRVRFSVYSSGRNSLMRIASHRCTCKISTTMMSTMRVVTERYDNYDNDGNDYDDDDDADDGDADIEKEREDGGWGGGELKKGG